MSELASVTGARPWPMTTEAADTLKGEIWRLRRQIAMLSGEGLEEGFANLALTQSTRRLETLLATQRWSELRDDPDCGAIGRKATVRHPDGEVVHYSIVCPGEGDPARSCVSADSPLGAALLGARAGASVEVAAPGGAWSVLVLGIK